MICGQNYHGGDIQNGCGAKFNWLQAKPYISQISSSQPKLVKIDTRRVNDQKLANHYPYKCDNCQENILGIRFECINCKSINYCENCEEDATLSHTRNHLFRLLYK